MRKRAGWLLLLRLLLGDLFLDAMRAGGLLQGAQLLKLLQGLPCLVWLALFAVEPHKMIVGRAPGVGIFGIGGCSNFKLLDGLPGLVRGFSRPAQPEMCLIETGVSFQGLL